MLMEAIFWTCFILITYVYVGYPATVFLLARLFQREPHKGNIEPKITVLISAFNEEREIEKTVINKLSQDYHPDKLEVIVVSDGSTDRTDQIVNKLAQYNERRVKFLRQEPRQGKTQALNMAVPHATGDILVFADANSLYAPDTIRRLVSNFADPSVGYVTGKMIYTNYEKTGIGQGSDSYIGYENFLRVLETQLGSVVGVDGGVDAIRSELYKPMQPDQLPDFVLPLNVIEQGKRVVYEPEAIVYESALTGVTDEFRMRVRVSLRALWALRDKRHLLNPLRYPLFAWQLLSHKALRYSVFLPFAGIFLVNLFLIEQHPFYLGFFLLQLAAYTITGVAHALRHSLDSRSKLVKPYYFFILNLACAVAFWKFLKQEKIVVWKPRTGN